MTVNDLSNGELKVEKGPQCYYLGPYEQSQGIGTAVSLSATQYTYIFNSQDGTYKTIKGPKVWIPTSPFERSEGVKEAITLKSNEYVTIEDHLTGIIRVERGEKIIYLEQTEKLKRDVETAVNIDSQTAVIVRNVKNGQVHMCTELGLFFPDDYEVVESVQKRIVLQDQHTIILKDQLGSYHFRTGGQFTDGKVDPQILIDDEDDSSNRKKKKKNNAPSSRPQNETLRAFFLPPFWEIVKLEWAVGPKKEERKKITVIDQRPHQMSYMFVCRTADSVELEIDCNFYWQITDVEKMISKTQNPTGDICFHARSVISQAVSQLTLDKFMNSFNKVVNTAVLDPEDLFYEERGLIIYSAEMRGLHCQDPSTEAVLQEIIKETTMRLNRLQKQTSDNEVNVLAVKGQIEKERLQGELLEIRREQRKQEKTTEGESEASQIKSFFDEFGGAEKINTSTALDIWNSLRKKDAIEALSNGTAQLYVTPQDVNLQIFPKK